MEGMYKQLRSQFDEKTRILSQTRKELFQTQGKLLGIEHHQYLSAHDPEREEAAFYEKELNLMSEEVTYFAEEVVILEDLISQFPSSARSLSRSA